MPTKATRNVRRKPPRRAHSPAASAIGRQVSSCHPIPGSRNRLASSSGTSTRAVSTRCLSADRAAPPSAAFALAGIPTGLTQCISRRFAAELLARSTEATLAAAIGIDRATQRLPIEVGPEFIGEIELGIGKLPEQEITDALFAAGADEQIRLGRIVHRKIRRKVCLAIPSRRLGQITGHALY